MSAKESEASRLLAAAQSGDASARARLTPLLYEQLRQLAQGQMRNERVSHTLQPTALVNEAFVRLLGGARLGADATVHFQAIAAATMRRVLIDHARRRNADKRGAGGDRVTLHEDAAVTPARDVDLLALEDALVRLAALDPRQAQIVELRFFGGLTADQIADQLSLSRRTVQDDWAMARAWLKRELSKGDTTRA